MKRRGKTAAGLALALAGFWGSTAHAIAIANDNWFSSESVTFRVVWTGADPETAPGPLRLLYRHWGDGGAAPATATDLLAGSGTKPPWNPFTGWSGATTRSLTTTHPKGSVSTSLWDLQFVTRRNPISPTTALPGINGSLTAIADKANLTFSSTDAHTETDWRDPFLFSIQAGQSATISVLHRFANDPLYGALTEASWTPDGLGYMETGRATVDRLFTGALTDSAGVMGDPFLLQSVGVGTSPGDIGFALGTAATLDDGLSAAQKLTELQSMLDPVDPLWTLSPGESILLDFTWTIDAAPYDRVAALDLSGGVFAEEAQVVPVPAAAWLLASAVALLAFLRRSRSA